MSKSSSNSFTQSAAKGALPVHPDLAKVMVFNDEKHHIRLFHGDCLELLEKIPESSVDLVFADPPYFLSNGGITCHAGKMVSVHKGDWDKSRGADENHAFNRAWLSACQRILKPNGSIWVSGTAHVIHSVGFAMQQLGFKLLNDISWVKPNPPPNLSCRYFTHATETIIWAAKNKKSRHTFNYKLMKEANRTARRAGYVGCYFVLDRIPPDAKIPVVNSGKVISPAIVRKAYEKVRPLEKLNIEKRGWTLDVLNVVRSLKKNEFTLSEVYDHADQLAELHPENHHINDKIRQQLQVLRDLNFLEFLGGGSYRLL